ncbi:MAG: hypothetical protein HKP27_06335 [Myxococcales bacterium]|nr:hypothetical protein [Myxococcales bacterium]
MMPSLARLDADEKALAHRAIALLALVIAGHTLLETARDALFLVDLPAASLPRTYLAIAFLALLLGALQRRLGVLASGGGLTSSLAIGAVGTCGFWWMLEARTPSILHGLYIWTGVLATLVVVQFWLRLAEFFDVTRAKVVFVAAAAGGLVGAVAGSALANVVVWVSEPRTLVVAAAAAFAAAAILAMRLPKAAAPPSPRNEPTEMPQRPALRRRLGDRYLVRLLWIAALAPITFTVIDYTFKHAVADAFPAEDLATFFARFYVVVNSAALILQLLVVPRLLQSLGAVSSLSIVPIALLASAAGFAVVGGLIAAIALKALDGSLRHSLHRACMEILYLPLPKDDRVAARLVAGSIGQRGGQALASVGLLLALEAGAGTRELSVASLVLCGVWSSAFFGLRRDYIGRFREQLARLRFDWVKEIPDLELDSLSTMVTALSSPREEEVLAAIDLFEAYDRVEMIPGLILYHPSRSVVLRSLELFANARRPDIKPLVLRLLEEHADDNVRSALVWQVLPDLDRDDLMRIYRGDASAEVRASAWLALLSSAPSATIPEQSPLVEALRVSTPDTHLAVAAGVNRLALPLRIPVARWLFRESSEPVREALARSLADEPSVEALPLLKEMLAERATRDDARRGLRAIGAPALRSLEEALRDPSTPDRIRRHLPRSISRFDEAEATEILLRALELPLEPSVHFKVLRGLGKLRAKRPLRRIAREPLMREAIHQLERGVELLQHYVVLSAAAVDHTEGLRALCQLLQEKRDRALEQVLRMLHVIDPSEDFEMIHEALGSEDAAVWGSAIELLSHAVPANVLAGIEALTAPGGDRGRLERAALFHRSGDLEHTLELLSGESARERDWARHRHAHLEALAKDPDALVSELAVYALREVLRS